MTVLPGIGQTVYPPSKAFIGPALPIVGRRVLSSEINRLTLGRDAFTHPDTVVPIDTQKVAPSGLPPLLIDLWRFRRRKSVGAVFSLKFFFFFYFQFFVFF